MFEIPSKEKNPILIAGAGGGYDFLCGLPIALSSLEKGSTIYFANYSFTNLEMVKNGKWHNNNTILEIDHTSYISDGGYFPEVELSKWFMEKKDFRVPIFCFPHLGIKSLAKCYNYLHDILRLSELYIVDGGCDGIFRGDEYDLGTPSMDAVSIIAASLLPGVRKYYMLTAFGSEGVNKEVSHAETLNRIADLTKLGSFLGVSALLKNNAVGRNFYEAVKYINRNMKPQNNSNIVSSIICAMDGKFGDTAVNEKTELNPIWVSPLTNLYWYFELEAVAKMKLFYEKALNTDSVLEVSQLIDEIRTDLKPKRIVIPI